jgi:hypothetical protein
VFIVGLRFMRDGRELTARIDLGKGVLLDDGPESLERADLEAIAREIATHQQPE